MRKKKKKKKKVHVSHKRNSRSLMKLRCNKKFTFFTTQQTPTKPTMAQVEEAVTPQLPGNASRDNSPAASRNSEIQKIRNQLKKRQHPKKGKKKPQTCGICKEKGHNRKTCPQNLLLARKKKRNKNSKKSPKKRQKSTEKEETQDATWVPSKEQIYDYHVESQENERRFLEQLKKKRKQNRAHLRKHRKRKQQQQQQSEPKKDTKREQAQNKEKTKEDGMPEELRSLADMPPCNDEIPLLMNNICPIPELPCRLYTLDDLKQSLRIRLCNVLLPVDILGHTVPVNGCEACSGSACKTFARGNSPFKSPFPKAVFRTKLKNWEDSFLILKTLRRPW